MALGDMFGKLREGLEKTRRNMVDKIQAVVLGYTHIDEDLYEDLEAILIQADVGVNTALELMERLREYVRQKRVSDPEKVPDALQELMAAMLSASKSELRLDGELNVIMVVGVNGVGKTTTIGKLAHRLSGAGHRPILAASDTFRAAAGEQLEIWGERTNCDVVRHAPGSDPAAVTFDAIQAARARKANMVIVDTAGRLHTKSNLMEELKKIRRVASREVDGAPQEVLLVLDASTGQNAVQQARTFNEAVEVTGIVLTKLDGTAKGGVVFSIATELEIPVKFIGIGEGLEDLRPFEPDRFAEALFSGAD